MRPNKFHVSLVEILQFLEMYNVHYYDRSPFGSFNIIANRHQLSALISFLHFTLLRAKEPGFATVLGRHLTNMGRHLTNSTT